MTVVPDVRPDVLVYDILPRRYINLNDTCTLKCTFCPKTYQDKKLHHTDLSLSKRPSAEQIIAALGEVTDFEEIVFCGFGEPTLRLKELLQIAAHIKKNKGRVRLNTDGLINRIYKRNVLPELVDKIDALSVSLNAQNETLYNLYCQPAIPGAYYSMLEFLKLAGRFIPDVTATAIEGLPGVDILACQTIAHKLGVKFRKRELNILGMDNSRLKKSDELHALRSNIDTIDDKILELINQRLEIVTRISEQKKRDHLLPVDFCREQEIIDRLTQLNKGPLNNEDMQLIMISIFKASHRHINDLCS